MREKKEKPFDFWNDHSLEFLEMAMKRDHQETVQKADGYGRSSRDCGDTIEIFLTRDLQDRAFLSAISYDIKGCLFSHACVNALIRLARGKTAAQAREIGPAHIVEFLKTLPKAEAHCARHAVRAFRMALDSLAS